MKHLIDKDALVAELNRLIAELIEGEDTMFEQGRISAFEDVKVFINHTLEVKEVDIEKEISKFIDTNFEKATTGHKISLRRTARYFYELGLKAQNK